jgi:hypothetical protein
LPFRQLCQLRKSPAIEGPQQRIKQQFKPIDQPACSGAVAAGSSCRSWLCKRN